MAVDDWVKIIAALTALMTAALGGASLVITAISKLRADIRSMKSQVDLVEKNANSLSERLERQSREAGHAEGELKGRADKTAEQAAAAPAREEASTPVPVTSPQGPTGPA